MTVEVILNLRIHNVIIHINFYQNRFINECVRKKNESINSLKKSCYLSQLDFRIAFVYTFYINILYLHSITIQYFFVYQKALIRTFPTSFLTTK